MAAADSRLERERSWLSGRKRAVLPRVSLRACRAPSTLNSGHRQLGGVRERGPIVAVLVVLVDLLHLALKFAFFPRFMLLHGRVLRGMCYDVDSPRGCGALRGICCGALAAKVQ